MFSRSQTKTWIFPPLVVRDMYFRSLQLWMSGDHSPSVTYGFIICFGTLWRNRNQLTLIYLQSPIDMRRFILVSYIRVWACPESPANLLYVFQFSHKLQNLRMFLISFMFLITCCANHHSVLVVLWSLWNSRNRSYGRGAYCWWGPIGNL